MPKRRAKSVTRLHPHLKPGPIKGNNTVQTNMTATIKVPRKIFYGKATIGPTEGKITKQREKVRDEVSWFEPFLPTILTYLQYLCNSFKAGQVATHFAAWRTLTIDSVLLIDVLGASIECIATPVQHRLPNQAFSESEYPIVCHDVHKLVERGVIAKTSPMPGQILSSIFLRPKKDGSYCV